MRHSRWRGSPRREVKPVKIEQRDIVELWQQGETVCVTVSLVFQRKEPAYDLGVGKHGLHVILP